MATTKAKKAPAKTKKPAKVTAKKAKAAAPDKGYVSGGQFLANLGSLYKLKKRAKAWKRESWMAEQLALLPADVAVEVGALIDLFAKYQLPELCRLRMGGFCTMPAQYDLDADGVRAAEWFTKAKDIELVMSSLELFNDQGSPFILIGKAGVIFFYEDPHGYGIAAKDLASFLKALIAAESAAKGKITANEARRVIQTNIIDKYARKANLFERTLRDAK